MKTMRMILAGLTILTLARSAAACGGGRMPSPAQRMALADTVIVGKVTDMESRRLTLERPQAGESLPYFVQVIRIQKIIKGVAGLTHLRLAILPHQVMPAGFEACFFLNQHREEPVHVYSSASYEHPIPRENNQGFDKQMEELSKMSRLLADPIASLSSASPEDRFLTAALLVYQLRTYQPERHASPSKQEPIDLALNRLILRALAGCDWNLQCAEIRLSPWQTFYLLDAQEKDGWKPVSGDHIAQAKVWLKDNEDRFRIQRFVHR